MLQQRLLIALLFGDIFAETRRSDQITGRGSQQGILPTNEPALAGTRQNLILMVPREGLLGENACKELPQVINFSGYEEFEPVPSNHLRSLPSGQLQKVIIAIGDTGACIEGHADDIGVAKQIVEVHAAQ